MMAVISSCAFAADVRLNWQANRDADLAGYRVHYGRSSGVYTQVIDAGNLLSCTITGLQENSEYFFALSAYDRAGRSSELSEEICGVVGDSQPPQITSIFPVSATELRLGFSEALRKSPAEDPGNYLIEPAVSISSAKLAADRKSVTLITASHQSDKTYQLKATHLYDLAIPANPVTADAVSYYFLPEGDDRNPPTIVLARLTSPAMLEVYFSEPVETASAADPSHYFIDPGVRVLSAVPGEAGDVVQLTTGEHLAGQNYTLTVSGVTDRSLNRNVILPNSYYSYSYAPVDLLGPVITLVQAVDAGELDILFNEPLDEASAETASHYGLQGGAQVLGAELDASGMVVHLRTTAHEAGRIYVVNVQGVCDASPQKNSVAAGTSYAYLFEPEDHTGPTLSEVRVRDASHLSVVFNEPVERMSAENAGHYCINNEIQIFNASLDASGRVVDLETAPHVSERIYLLTVNQVLDATDIGNEILPNSSYAYVVGDDSPGVGPTIVTVEVADATTLRVRFSKEVERASAEEAGHFQLTRGCTVISAQLDQGRRIVTLKTSPHEANCIYILRVSNVTDDSAFRNLIAPNSSYSYVFDGEDTVGPVITQARALDAEHLDVLFNEQVNKASAEEAAHYSISGNITVKNAQLDGSQRIVHLQTSVHAPQKLYVLRITGVEDGSFAGNEILANSAYAYLYEPSDAMPPTLAMVRVLDPQHLEVSYSEAVESGTAWNVDHYAINNGVQVLQASAGTGPHQLVLQVTPLAAGKIYLLMVNQVADVSGNGIAANSSYAFSFGNVAAETLPAIVGITFFSDTGIEVEFNMALEKSAAEGATNYHIQGISVLSARLDPSQTRVLLSTSKHEPNRLYILMVEGVYRQGRPDLMILAHTPFFYMMPEDDQNAPSVLQVATAGETLVEIGFSRPVERLSAENRRNYHIDGGVAVLFATLDDAGTRVTLETSRHRAGQVYTLSIAGVRSEDGAVDVESAIRAYTYMPGLQVGIRGSAETLMSFLDVGRPYYVDRNYVITTAPAELLRCRMIMTANSDKGRSDGKFISLQLNQATILYVGYDAGAATAPTWLASRFMKTSLTLGVSESSAQLALWAGYFPAGSVELAGNNAAGASGAKCMYIVLLQEPAFATLLSSGELESLQQKSRELPARMALHANYPNPFNSRTTIRYELPVDQSVRLAVYDLLGRQVRVLFSGQAAAGVYALVWDGMDERGTPVAAGLYFYRLEVWAEASKAGVAYRKDYRAVTGKMIYLK